MNSIECKRCGNKDEKLLTYHNGKLYCRACNKYSGKLAHISKYIHPKIIKANLSYSLSKQQTSISDQVCLENKEIYVDAVCGAGKT